MIKRNIIYRRNLFEKKEKKGALKNVINEKLVVLMTFLEKSSLVFLLNFKLRNSRSLECKTCVRVSVSLTPIFYYQQPDIELRTMNY